MHVKCIIFVMNICTSIALKKVYTIKRQTDTCIDVGRCSLPRIRKHVSAHEQHLQN
uniref:Uncharacterized protein n=1 Tax=Anguilla anguilla TaxID=7936 RepID=A0A0E9SIK5_ANGAN